MMSDNCSYYLQSSTTGRCWQLLLAMLLCVAPTTQSTSLTESLLLAADKVELHKRIDELIDRSAGNLVPAATADDAEFHRRIWLDLAGVVPTAKSTREFLSDSSPERRTKLIDQLLTAPSANERLADLFHVMLMERRGDDDAWQQWLKGSFEQNKPWDQLIREVLNPDADDEDNRAAAWFMTRHLENYGQNPIDYPGLVRDVGRLFLGMDLQCAECHDHLFIDDYKQADFKGLFVVYQNTFIRKDVKFPAIGEKTVTNRLEFVSVFDPTQKMVGPRLPGGPEFDIPEIKLDPEAGKAARSSPTGRPAWSAVELLAREITRSDNRQFARNAVNRLWFAMLGRGLVHPLDLHHSGNPPSHPELLETLTDEFMAHSYDVRWLLREIALSQTYQRSSRASDVNHLPRPETFLVASEKRLSAEQLLNSVLRVTGYEDAFAIEQAASATQSSEAGSSDGAGADRSDGQAVSSEDLSNGKRRLPTVKDLRKAFLDSFANDAREPEDEFSATVKGALFWRNSDLIQTLLTGRPGGFVDRLVASPSNQRVDELFLTVLSRLPDDEERIEFTAFLEPDSADANQHAVQLETAITDATWALMTSIEFYANH